MDQTHQLLTFKNSLPDPSVLHNWLPNHNPCSFLSVSCRDTLVSSINLSSVTLNTNFSLVSTYLLTLDHLRVLNLRGTNLSGTISFSAGSSCSSSLSSLDLSQNTLSGSVSSLNYLTSCSALKSLNLSGNLLEFSGRDSAGLRLSLQVVDLSYNNKISGPNVLPWILSQGCDGLKLLSLKGNRISGAMNFSPCKALQHLDLSSNNFSLAVPSFGECLALEYLDISANKFYGDIGRAISSCKQLSYLNISSNEFSGPVPSLPSGSLQFLYLANNHFQGQIPASLSDLCLTLVILDLSSNNLSGVLPSDFRACSSLESFDISHNKFTGELPVDFFAELTGLKRLVLSFNDFTGTLPRTLAPFSKLESLDLGSNNLTGSIPGGLCEDPRNNLKELYLPNNLLTGSIPPTLSNCSQLVTLDLSFNYLTGTIPSSFGSLSKLKDLILWLNQLRGEIPQELEHIKTLENLILDFNELSGTIPSGLSNCTSMNWLSLSNNRLSGEIPAWIGQLSNLAILKLSNNSFSGRIPPELGDCRRLIWLDLNTNYLNGSIPTELFKQSGKIEVNFISRKTYVYIKTDGSKQCHGAGNLLEFAGIQMEQMSRISSRSPCNFTSFTRVYNGKVRPKFNSGSMIFLDISHNMLSGTLPKEMGSMNTLFILNLGYNDISGSIPPEFGDMKNLNILDLSNNRLEGQIPQTLTGISMLTEIDLSNNNLSGLIPESGQFDTFPAAKFANNSGLCGVPLVACGSDSRSGANARHQRSNQRRASLARSVSIGLLFALFCILGLIIIALEARKRRKKKEATLDVYIDSRSHSGTANAGWKVSVREALSINLATFEKPLRKLTFGDLLEATNGFHNDSLIGKGGFGDVYKAQLKDGSVVAIKKLIHISGQGDREFTAEMETIGKIKHRNLVPLLG